MTRAALCSVAATAVVASFALGFSRDSVSAPPQTATNLRIATGFKLDQLYTVPGETEGSWIAMAVDPNGRLIVADQYGKLYRVTLPPTDRRDAVRMEAIDLDIGGAHGLLYAFGSLYVMVNEGTRPHGLYRVRDANGDDRFDEVKLLREITASGEHGAHAIVLSPDGRSLYVVVGNQSELTRVSTSRVPMIWSEDNLVPRIPTGFMDNSMAPQGWIARTDPDGKEWELIASGFRNEFDAAFNRAGELFTYDADMEWDIGAPWYRPTRINHVISGAEYGFRNGSGKWPDYFIDSYGGVVNVGPGSPTGITFGYGAKFPAKYQDALFIADWSFGKIRAVHLTPAGASYSGTVEEFISDQPLGVTDVVINPVDGAMYFTVGGRRTQSLLYRVTYVGRENTAATKADVRLGTRDARRALERFHGVKDPRAVSAAWPHLKSHDRAMRFAARTAIEWQDVSLWREKALSERDARTAIAALVSLARVSGRDSIHRKPADPRPDAALQRKMLASLGTIAWSRLAPADQLDLLRAYSLVFTRLGAPADDARQPLIARFDPLFPAATRDLNLQLANLLVYLQAPSAAGKIMATFRAATTQEEQIEYALALRALRTGWTMPLREEYFRWFVTTASAYRGGNTFARALTTIKNDAVKNLTPADAVALKPVLEMQPAPTSSPHQVLAARSLVKDYTVDELVPVVDRGLRGGRNFERGRALYSVTACAACHRFVDRGGSVGPDLTTVSGRFSTRDLLESVIAPSKAISDQYAAISIRKKNGQIVTGRVGNLNGPTVSVVEDMLDPGKFTNVLRQDIESIEPSPVSMMPRGLLNTLKPDEIQDLMAYLLSRGDPKHRAFR